MLEKVYLLIEVLSMILCLCGLYGKKFRIDIPTIGIITINILVFSLVSEGIISEKYMIVTYLGLFLYCIFEYSSEIKLAIINYFLCIALLLCIQLICMVPISMIAEFVTNEQVLALMANSFLFLSVLVILKIFRLNKISEYLLNREWFFYAVTMFCLCLLVYIMLKHKLLQYIFLETYIICMISVMLAVALTYKWQKSNAKVREKEIEINLNKIYFNAYSELIDSLRKKQHDIDNHINAIYSQHYTCSSLEELVDKQRAYCKYLESDNKYASLLKIDDPIIGGFLYSKFQSINNENIEVLNEVKIWREFSNIPKYELISIIGILVDNAREAVYDLDNDERKICFKVFEENNKQIIEVMNICDYMKNNQILNIFKKGYSTKGNNRGMGLYNVKEKSSKYGFSVLVENKMIEDKNWISFKLIF